MPSNAIGDNQSLQSHTDSSGGHVLSVSVLRDVPAHPVSISATANVQDVNRQSWGSTAPLLIHPSKLYVGLHAERTLRISRETLPSTPTVIILDGV